MKITDVKKALAEATPASQRSSVVVSIIQDVEAVTYQVAKERDILMGYLAQVAESFDDLQKVIEDIPETVVRQMPIECLIPPDMVIESFTNTQLEHVVAVAQAELDRRAAVASKGPFECPTCHFRHGGRCERCDPYNAPDHIGPMDCGKAD